MSCGRMETRILAYVDGRLKESERAEVQKHLDGCAACHRWPIPQRAPTFFFVIGASPLRQIAEPGR